MRERSRMYGRIRQFFDDRDYVEVDTPILSETLIPESTISCFATSFTSEFHHSRDYYLIPSPEIHMKRLIGEGYGNIYQITKCFRNAEQIGSQHNPEFSMLEWYTVGEDSHDAITITEELIQAVSTSNTPEHVRAPFERMTVAEAFFRHTGIDLDTVQAPSAMRAALKHLGLQESRVPESWEDMFNRIFLTLVEPNLPADHPVVLTEYPIQIRCLAKPVKGTPYRDRWELYIAGVELANCYTEMTDGEAVRACFTEEYARLSTERAVTGETIPDIDDAYYSIFDGSYPECSGVAMGLDRLFMALHSIKTIQGVILFPFSDTIGRR